MCIRDSPKELLKCHKRPKKCPQLSRLQQGPKQIREDPKAPPRDLPAPKGPAKKNPMNRPGGMREAIESAAPGLPGCQACSKPLTKFLSYCPNSSSRSPAHSAGPPASSHRDARRANLGLQIHVFFSPFFSSFFDPFRTFLSNFGSKNLPQRLPK